MLVGTIVLLLHTAVSFLGFLFLQWLIANPPDPFVFVSVFVVVVLFGAYIGYRQGTVRVVASLDTQEISKRRAPQLHQRLDRLCLQMDVSRPMLLVADLEAPNALSVGGPREGAVIIDYRLFDLLTIEELEGILAHELAHIERYDTFLNTVVITASRMVVGLVFVALLPVIVFLLGVDRATAWYAGQPHIRHIGLAGLFQRLVGLTVALFLSIFTLLFFAYSRRQEFAADHRAAEVTGRPLALARALIKIHRAMDRQRGLRSLLYIHDEHESKRSRWLSTHPPLDERVERLRAQAEREIAQHRLRKLQQYPNKNA